LFQVPWKSLGKEPVIVLIDRVFVLAYPAPDDRTLKVFCWNCYLCLLVFSLSFSLWLVLNLLTLITYQEEDREKLLETKLQQIEVLRISGWWSFMDTSIYDRYMKLGFSFSSTRFDVILSYHSRVFYIGSRNSNSWSKGKV
jgi:hypothetical protein